MGKLNPQNIRKGDWVRAKDWYRNYKVTRVINGAVHVLLWDNCESLLPYNILKLNIKKTNGPEGGFKKEKKKPVKSNPHGLKKGQWVTKRDWKYDYQISRVKNGRLWLIKNSTNSEHWYDYRICDSSPFIRVKSKVKRKFVF